MKHCKNDPESVFLTAMLADQFKEVEHDLDATYHFRCKVPDTPNPWKLLFAVEIPNLDATYERIRKKEAWAQREATKSRRKQKAQGLDCFTKEGVVRSHED